MLIPIASLSAAKTVWRCVAAAGLLLVAAACSNTGAVLQNAQGEPGDNVLLAMATGQTVAPNEVVEREVLAEQRGGFITVGGRQIDFGFIFETFVNGVPQLRSVLTLNDILSSGGSVPQISSLQISGEEGLLQIIHSGGPNGIGATIITDQNGQIIRNVATLAIDIVNLNQIRKGGPSIGNGGPLPLEIHQAFVNSLQ